MSDSIPHFSSDKLFTLSRSKHNYEELLDTFTYYVITDSSPLSPKSEESPFLCQGLFWQSFTHLYHSLLLPQHSEYIRSLMGADSVLYMVRRLLHQEHGPQLSLGGEKALLSALSSVFNLRNNPELTKFLLATGHKKLVYHSNIDKILSDGLDGFGSNLYGKMLTQIRNELKLLALIENCYGSSGSTGTLHSNLNEENLNEDFNTSIRNGEIYPAKKTHINGESSELSMLLPSSLEAFSYGEYRWPSVEHFYQAKKYKFMDEFLSQQSTLPKLRKIVYEDKVMKSFVRKSFREERIGIMYTGLKMKLEEYPETKRCLLATKNDVLMYSNQDETYWGCGKTERGENFIGKILMFLRKEFRFEERKLDTYDYPSLNFPIKSNVNFPKEYFDSLLLRSLHSSSK